VLPLGTKIEPAPAVQSYAGAPSVLRVWTSMGKDTHPPLHPMLLRAWSWAAGESDSAGRGLSLMLSLGTIALLFESVRVLHGHTPALWAAVLLAVATPQIHYAQEIRSYAMVLTIGAAALAVAARVARCDASGLTGARGWRLAIALAAVCLVGMLTHYWAVGVLAPAALVALWQADQMMRRRLLLSLSLAAGVFLLVWGPFMWEQRGNFEKNMRWLSDTAPGHLMRSLRLTAVLPLRLLVEPSARFADDVAIGTASPIVYAPFVLLVIGIGSVLRRREPAAWLWIGACALPIALVLLADLSQQRKTLSLVRYTLPASLGLVPLLAIMLSQRRDVMRHAVPGVCVAMCLIGLPRAWDRAKPAWRELASAVQRANADDATMLVLCPPDGHWMGAIVYMAVTRYTGTPGGPVMLINGPADEKTMQALRSRGRVVIVSNATSPPIDAWLPGAGRLISNERAGAVGSVQVLATENTPPQ
jgi:4-amino-4-deoxy-L-arabinose transferase-like glycosyltransferase